MAVNRSSTSLVRYLGTTVKSGSSGSSRVTNVTQNARGGETRIDPAGRRFSQTGLQQDAIKIADYQAALGYLGQRGVDPLVAKTMAAVFVDVAKSQSVSVMSLFENNADLSLVNNEVLNRLNQLRDLSSQLSSSNPIDNTASVPARRIQA